MGSKPPRRACVCVPTTAIRGRCMAEDNKRGWCGCRRERDPCGTNFGALGFRGPRPKAAKAFDRKGLVMYCSSFSKTISSGFRVGWAVPGRRHQEFEHLKFVNSVAAAATLPELALAEFLAHGGYERHLRSVRPVYAHNAERMTQAIARLFPEGTRVHPAAGGVCAGSRVTAEGRCHRVAPARHGARSECDAGRCFPPSRSTAISSA